jgi:hypothetical protein
MKYSTEANNSVVDFGVAGTAFLAFGTKKANEHFE